MGGKNYAPLTTAAVLVLCQVEILAMSRDGPTRRRRRSPERLTVSGSELQLDVVRVAEGQDVHAKGVAEIGDFAVGHPSFVQQLPRALELVAAGHAEAEVIE